MSNVNDLSSEECTNCGYDLLDEKRFALLNSQSLISWRHCLQKYICSGIFSIDLVEKNIEDIYEGVIYRKKIIDHGVLSNPHNISLL